MVHLNFQEEQTVELNAPSHIWKNLLNSNNKFYVEISEPNQGQDDEHLQ